MKEKVPYARRPGVIRSSETYTAAELKSRLGWGAHAFNRARAKGLKCRRIGNTRFITGEEFLDWLKDQPHEDLEN